MPPKIPKPKKSQNSSINERIKPAIKVSKEGYIRFSFKYLEERENFEWGDVDKGWYSAFLNRLSELESHTWEELEANSEGITKSIFYHAIKWEDAIVLKREDINWIPDEYKNDEDYPIYQLAVTKGKGRLHGFKDEKGIFNILLIDINHNLQPSQKHNYQIRPTRSQKSSIDILQASISMCEHASECPCLIHNSFPVNVISFKFDLDAYKIQNGLTKTISPNDFCMFFEAGLEQMKDIL